MDHHLRSLQSPAGELEATEVSKGGGVAPESAVVCRPSRRVLVGDFVGLEAGLAIERVRAAGLIPAPEAAGEGQAVGMPGRVAGQHPPVGTELARGQVVVLVVGGPAADRTLPAGELGLGLDGAADGETRCPDPWFEAPSVTAMNTAEALVVYELANRRAAGAESAPSAPAGTENGPEAAVAQPSASDEPTEHPACQPDPPTPTPTPTPTRRWRRVVVGALASATLALAAAAGTPRHPTPSGQAPATAPPAVARVPARAQRPSKPVRRRARRRQPRARPASRSMPAGQPMPARAIPPQRPVTPYRGARARGGTPAPPVPGAAELGP